MADVRRAAAAAGIRERCLATVAQIVEFFGRPAVVRTDRLVYDLALWPAHQFVWAVSRWGDAGPVGLRLRETVPIAPMRVDGDVEQLRAQLRPWYHTEHEVRWALGPAHHTIGDGPSSRWLYLASPGRVSLEFEFSWGLLRDISTRLAPAGVFAGELHRRKSRRDIRR